MARKLEPPPFQAWNIVCPYCQQEYQKLINSDETSLICPVCGKNYTIKVATVRAKRTQKLSYHMARNYLRIITRSGEEELSFDNTLSLSREFGLRSGDHIYIIYSSKQPKQPLQIFNETINTRCSIQIGVGP